MNDIVDATTAMQMLGNVSRATLYRLERDGLLKAISKRSYYTQAIQALLLSDWQHPQKSGPKSKRFK
jgi:hypothetical protein